MPGEKTPDRNGATICSGVLLNQKLAIDRRAVTRFVYR